MGYFLCISEIAEMQKSKKEFVSDLLFEPKFNEQRLKANLRY